MTRLDLTCEICGSSFQRERGEVMRSLRLGRPSFCSRSCAGQANLKNIPPEKANRSPPKGRKADQYSPFRTCHRIAWRRARYIGQDFDLTLDDLKEIGTAQNGICPYTGWKLVLPSITLEYNRMAKIRDTHRASLDRINSSLGYVKGNVQFVCYMANMAKADYTHDQMLEFCRAIAVRWRDC